ARAGARASGRPASWPDFRRLRARRWQGPRAGSFGRVRYSPPVPYSAEFRCFNGCEGSWPVTRPIYRCPRCDGLLSVVHDMDALRDRSGAAWMKLFDDRYKQNVWPYGSGVWGKREWVMPVMPDDLIVSM